MSLEYEPISGMFRHVPPCSNNATRYWHLGSFTGAGRVTVWWGGRNQPAARVAWELYYGTPPIGTVDHIDGDPTNNSILNLRDVAQSTNNENIRKPRAHNTSGVQGVKIKGNRYIARISVRGKSVHLGSFLTAEAAYAAYVEAKRSLHTGNTL